MIPYEIIYQDITDEQIMDMCELFHIDHREWQYIEDVSDYSIRQVDDWMKVFKYEPRTEPNTFLVSNRELSSYPNMYRVYENYYLRLFSMSKADLQNYIDRYKAYEGIHMSQVDVIIVDFDSSQLDLFIEQYGLRNLFCGVDYFTSLTNIASNSYFNEPCHPVCFLAFPKELDGEYKNLYADSETHYVYRIRITKEELQRKIDQFRALKAFL